MTMNYMNFPTLPKMIIYLKSHIPYIRMFNNISSHICLDQHSVCYYNVNNFDIFSFTVTQIGDYFVLHDDKHMQVAGYDISRGIRTLSNYKNKQVRSVSG